MDAKAQTAKGDARINIVVEVIMNTRFERLKRMLEVRDMRRNDGRVQLREEATAILAALDAHDIVLAEDINSSHPRLGPELISNGVFTASTDWTLTGDGFAVTAFEAAGNRAALARKQIQRAVNLHDDLVAAARGVMSELEGWVGSYEFGTDKRIHALRLALSRSEA